MNQEMLLALAKEVASIKRDLTTLQIWRMATRDTIGRLVSYVAMSDVNPDSILLHFSESGDKIADELINEGEDFGAIAERMRQEKDALIAYARSLLRREM